MPSVAYEKGNIEKCWCGTCPVQRKSVCAKELHEACEGMETLDYGKGAKALPPPERLGGLYCSTGQTICTDVKFMNLCNCPACLVWGENHLASNHYCLQGSADQLGR
jgi:Protein of unknown function (DUF2769)